jgi:hypothetical protein
MPVPVDPIDHGQCRVLAFMLESVFAPPAPEPSSAIVERLASENRALRARVRELEDELDRAFAPEDVQREAFAYEMESRRAHEPEPDQGI